MTLRVAAAHYAPVLLDRGATLDKVVRIIAEAGAAGVRLLGFPETFVPGYPYWLAVVAFDEQGAVNRRYAEESVDLAGEDLKPVARACGKHRVNVVLGVSERYGGTLFNTQVFIDDRGEVVGIHRKLQPTQVERALWGQGDGSTLRAYDLGVGRVGALICGEHSLNLARQALITQHPQFHVAAWPGGGAVRALDEWFRGHIWAQSRSHAYSSGCFLIAAADPMTRDNLAVIEEALGPQPKLQTGGARSLILDPLGNTLARHDAADEKLLCAEVETSAGRHPGLRPPSGVAEFRRPAIGSLTGVGA